jgi:hypothetical protein
MVNLNARLAVVLVDDVMLKVVQGDGFAEKADHRLIPRAFK